MKNGPYELVVCPSKYPGKRYRGRYCYEHHLVFWQKTGKMPPNGFEIHHVNGDHRDNSFKNIALVTASEHRKLHGAIQKSIHRVQVKCTLCNKAFELKGSKFRERKRNNPLGKIFCGRSCQVRDQWKHRRMKGK